ncbi:hypothetical protein COO60DRAFT_1638610 [Scenedesmus sp. NREL 46B-D3]|nr:hypothetical protein COO60DRAFT_1638610 [Scenedesmus sp. NREL 46B-D3]
MNPIHLAATVNTLGNWQQSGRLAGSAQQQHDVQQLLSDVNQLPQLKQVLAQCRCQELSQLVWGLGLLGHTGTGTFAACLDRFLQRHDDIERSQQVSNVLYGAAKAGQLKVEQFQQLLAALAVSNSLWACAQLRVYPAELFAALDSQQQWGRLLPAMTGQHLVITALACAVLDHRDEQLMNTLLQQAQQWQLSSTRSKRLDEQALLSIDIAGVTADGVRLAIEVDGPAHFLWPGNRLDGSTQHRNRVLAARFTLCSCSDGQLQVPLLFGITLTEFTPTTRLQQQQAQVERQQHQQQGHPVAVVSAREASAGLSAVINSALRRFLNSPTAADDMPALLAWWQDEWQRACGAGAAISGAAAAPARGHRTPKTGSKARSRAAAGDALDMDLDCDPTNPAAAAAAAGGGAAAVTPPRTAGKAAAAVAETPATAGRELRARSAPGTPGRPGCGGAAAARGGGCSSLGVPVLVLQEADAGDLEALEELVVALSEARTAGLPIVLVLGVSSSPACLLQLLPNALLRRASLLSLALPPARQQLVQVYRQLLLSEPVVLLGPQLSSWLLQHFRDADCSASMAERVVQLACVEHFRTQPLSSLTAAATSGSRAALARAVAALPPQQLTRCCQALLAHPALAEGASSGELRGSSSSKRSPAGKVHQDRAASTAAVAELQAFVRPSGGKQQRADKAAAAAAAAAAGVLEEAVWGAMQAFGRWRLGVLLLHMLAEFTGLAGRDASLQLPSLFSAASQQYFLHSSKRGSLSPCGHLLLKLLGNSSSDSSSSSSSRSGVLAVRDLPDADCLQLLGKLLHLVAAGGQEQQQQQQQQQDGEMRGQQMQRRAAGCSTHAGNVISDSEDSSSASDSESDSDDDKDEESKPDPATDNVLGSCLEVQQLQQALAALQAAAAGAAAAPGMLAATAADGDDGAMLTSPQKKQSRHHTQQDQQQQQQHVLAAFTASFATVLAPLPELLEPTTAAPFSGLLSSAAAAAAGTPGSVSTPVSKAAAGKAGRGSDPLPTPGGLASALRRHVRFAPDTPNHAASKAGPAGSNMSTPDGAAAVAGHIKTPSKKVSKPAQPRKSLFGAPAAGPAAAGAAAAAADGGKVRRKRGENQKDEEGDIAGTSAAALAAAVAAASGSAGRAAGAAFQATNKRSQRMMQLLAASGPSGGNSPGSHGGRGSSTPVGASRRGSSSSRGLLSTPLPVDAGADAAAVGSPETPLSPRGRAGRRQRGAAAATAAAAAASDDAAGTLTSPRGGARGTSRLARQLQPQHVAAAAEELDEVDSEDETDVDERGEQQLQQKGKGKTAAAVAAPEAAALSAASCSAALASLLSAVIPKLLLPWCSPSSAASSSTSSSSSSSSTLCSPLAAAGAAAFVYDDLAHVSTLLCPAPRCAVHAALTGPAQRMPGHPQHLGPGWEDTCLAYMLLQQQREDGLAVADWFGLFCQAQGVKGFSSAANEAAIVADEQGAAAPGAGRAARARARQGRKARGYAEARDSAAAAAAHAQGSSSSKKKAGGSSSRDQATPRSAAKKRAAAAADADSCDDQQQQQQQQQQEVDQEELMAAAARFCQSAAELQLLGVWKGSKRRRLAAVTRVFAPEGPGMVLRGAAAGGAAAAALESLPDHDYDY